MFIIPALIFVFVLFLLLFPSSRKVTLLFAVLFALVPWFAWAQDKVAYTVNLQPLWDGVLPYIITALGIIITAAATWAAYQFQRMTGMKVEQKDMEALHSAALTGAKLIVVKAGGVLPTNIAVGSQSLQTGIQWMVNSVPDAISRTGITPEKMAGLLQSKLPEAQAISSVAPVPVVNVSNVTPGP